MRVADNVQAIRAQWCDVDVGDADKKYPTIKAAIQGVVALCKQLHIPAPMIVQSGGGIHCYWPFTRDVPAAEARQRMRGFSAAARAMGFKHDPSRTADTASILRPIGTTWRKDGAIPVRLLRDAAPMDPDMFYAQVAEYIPPPANRVVGTQDEDDEWSTGPREYPPSSAVKVAIYCPTMGAVAAAAGNVPEPLWRLALGLVKNCTEGEELAHAWSQGHPAYDREETTNKFARWEVGPPTCEQFAGHSDACTDCPHSDTVRSPIHLGYDIPPAQTTGEAAGDEQPETPSDGLASTPIAAPAVAASAALRRVVAYNRRLPQNVPYWPTKYRWDGQFLSVFTKDPSDPLDPGTWQPFLTRLLYPFMRYPDDEGEMQVRVSALTSTVTNKWRDFDIPAKALADNKALASALGAYEVYGMGEKGTVATRRFFQDIIANMQDMDVETNAYSSFGWQEDAFVIGSTAITKSSIEPVYLSDRVPSDARCDFGVKGTAQDWADLVDHIYNREGAEPYQFMICAGFGAPLISLVRSDLWHGIPIALTGEGGLGKTTTCMVACSMYGSPGKFAISTNELGSTMNALISRVGLMRHLPLVLDEMTGRTTQELQAMLYALSNGKPKERNRPDGTLIDTQLRWDTTTFITGNINITGMLSALDKNRAEATQLRCFEIMIEDGFNDRVFAGINAKDLIEQQLLGNCYGAAGQKYLQYVITNHEAITKQLHKLRSRFCPDGRDMTRERFYFDALATALLGGMIAKKLGLINFDLNGIQKWATAHIKTLRFSRHNNLSTVEDYLAEFLSSLHGRTVVTEKYTDSRTAPIFEVDTREVRNPVARIVREDHKFYVANKYMTEWCSENGIQPKWFKDELDKRNLLVLANGKQDNRVSLFKGTSLPTTQARCVELNYDLLMEHHKAAKLSVVTGKQQTV